MKILSTTNVSKEIFIEYWNDKYLYPNNSLYENNISNNLTESVIIELFTWKNGTPLSEKKRISILNNYIKDTTIFPDNPDNDFIKKELLKSGGSIWRIFWLHCNYPNIYPIYDQHVHRAMAYILEWDNIEIPTNNYKKVEIYLNTYIPFFQSFERIESKKIDNALWAYGKFIKDNKKIIGEF